MARRERMFVGVSCGPGFDGAEAALVRIAASRDAMKAAQEAFVHRPMPEQLARRLRDEPKARPASARQGQATRARAVAPEDLAALDRDVGLLLADAAAGSHCCSNTDWSIFLGGPVRAVSFDAWEFADNFLVYRDDLRAFLEGGGTIVWGIVPTDPEAVAAVTVDALLGRMDGHLAKVQALGFTRSDVLRQSLVTPACGLGTRPLETADRAFALTRDLADRLRNEYLGG